MSKTQINEQTKEWYEYYPIITDPVDFFGNTRKGDFIKIANIEIPLEEARKYQSKEDCLKANLV